MKADTIQVGAPTVNPNFTSGEKKKANAFIPSLLLGGAATGITKLLKAPITQDTFETALINNEEIAGLDDASKTKINEAKPKLAFDIKAAEGDKPAIKTLTEEAKKVTTGLYEELKSALPKVKNDWKKAGIWGGCVFLGAYIGLKLSGGKKEA